MILGIPVPASSANPISLNIWPFYRGCLSEEADPLLARIFDAGRIRSGLENTKETRPSDETGNSEPDSLRCGGSQGTLKSVPLTTVLAAAGSSIRKSKAIPVPRRNKDFEEQYEVLKKKRMIRVQLYGSTSGDAYH
jgi:hypothetical protein